MREQKRVLTMSAYEYRLAMYALIHIRNQLLAQGRYTDAVDELILMLQTQKPARLQPFGVYKTY